MSTATAALKVFTPSPRQAAIFAAFFALAPGGTLQINAVAGSGKSTTLEQLIARMNDYDRNDTLLCAFGRDIKKALEDRVRRNGWKCTVKTLHGLGWAALNAYYSKPGARWNAQCDGTTKYNRLIQTWFINRGRDPYAKPGEAEEAMFPLVNMVRITLTNWKDAAAVQEMAAYRGLDMPDPALMCECLRDVCAWGINGLPKPDAKGFTYKPTEWIDYTDQVWLPHVFNLTPPQFGNILVDECQDLNAAQTELVMKARKPGGKMIFVGDPMQAIFAFAGANSDSFDAITKATNAVVMPLDVCYRCPSEVIELAKILVPAIEAAPTASRGVVQVVGESFFYANASERDMILCRTTAPLIEKFFKLVGEGKRAKVKGRDFSAQLKKIVEQVSKLEGFDFDKFQHFVSLWMNNQLRAIENKDNADNLRQNIQDRADCIAAVYEGAKALSPETMKTVQDLTVHIENIFADDDEKGCILLSTIHRAKGLEADNVYFLHPELCPHPMAKNPDAVKQEYNLKYVAYTRAMKALYIVDSKGKYTPAVIAA